MSQRFEVYYAVRKDGDQSFVRVTVGERSNEFGPMPHAAVESFIKAKRAQVDRKMGAMSVYRILGITQ